MASNKMTTNAWSGPLAAAVGALYKDYMTRPTAADALKAQLMQEQLATAPMEREKLQLGNRDADLRLGYGVYEGMPAAGQMTELFSNYSPDKREVLKRFQNPYQQTDFGGVQGKFDPFSGGYSLDVVKGADPRVDINKENGQIVPVNAVMPQLLHGTAPVEVFPPSIGQPPAQPQQSSGPFPPNLTQGRGVGARDIDTSNIQPLSIEELNAPVSRGQTPIPSLLPAQGDSAGIPLPIASDDPSLNGDVQQPAQGGQPLVGAVQNLPPNPADVAKKGETDRVRNIQADIVNDDVRRALDLSEKSGGVPTTGLLGGAASFVPGTDAYNMKELLDTLEANTAFDRLESMRLRSPTGAALGSVQVRELELLGKVLGSLKQSATKEQFQYNLMRFNNAYNDLIHGAGNGPRYDLGMTESGGNALNPDVQSLLDKYAP